MGEKQRVVCWFSCGVTSAVAAKIAIDSRLDDDVRVVYCDTRSEHEDNRRFLHDCEEWLGQPIEIIASEKYRDVWDVWEKTRWLVGPGGTRCTVELKKVLRREYEDPDDIQVFGFDPSETARADRFRENNIEVNLWTPLIDQGVTKAECGERVMRAGIELPAMYRLGYRHANCPACPLGGMGYWNKVRVDFPEHFDRMAKLERDLDAAICKTYPEGPDGPRVRVFLDELDPDAGNYSAEPALECGLLCGVQEELF